MFYFFWLRVRDFELSFFLSAQLFFILRQKYRINHSMARKTLPTLPILLLCCFFFVFSTPLRWTKIAVSNWHISHMYYMIIIIWKITSVLLTLKTLRRNEKQRIVGVNHYRTPVYIWPAAYHFCSINNLIIGNEDEDVYLLLDGRAGRQAGWLSDGRTGSHAVSNNSANC